MFFNNELIRCVLDQIVGSKTSILKLTKSILMKKMFFQYQSVSCQERMDGQRSLHHTSKTGQSNFNYSLLDLLNMKQDDLVQKVFMFEDKNE
jgi:hypothetical protein